MISNDILKGINETIEHSMSSEDELMHYRTKGSKNGERRYQNKDGTWTPLGLKLRRLRESDGDLSPKGKERYEKASYKERTEFEKAEQARAEKAVIKGDKKMQKLEEKFRNADGNFNMKKTQKIAAKQAALREKLADEIDKYDKSKARESTNEINEEKRIRDQLHKEDMSFLKSKGLSTTDLEVADARRRDAQKMVDKSHGPDSDNYTEEERKKYREERDAADEAYSEKHRKAMKDAGHKDYDYEIDETASKDAKKDENNKSQDGNKKTSDKKDEPKKDNKDAEKKDDPSKPDADEIAYYDPETKEPVLKKDVEARKRLKDNLKAENEYDKALATYKENHPGAEELARREREEAWNRKNDDLDATAKKLEGASNVAKSGKNIADLVARTQKGKMDADKKAEMDAMDDATLQKRINRIQMEQRYAELNPNETQRRAQQAANILEGLGHVATIGSTVASTASSVRKILGFARFD